MEVYPEICQPIHICIYAQVCLLNSMQTILPLHQLIHLQICLQSYLHIYTQTILNLSIALSDMFDGSIQLHIYMAAYAYIHIYILQMCCAQKQNIKIDSTSDMALQACWCRPSFESTTQRCRCTVAQATSHTPSYIFHRALRAGRDQVSNSAVRLLHPDYPKLSPNYIYQGPHPFLTGVAPKFHAPSKTITLATLPQKHSIFCMRIPWDNLGISLILLVSCS